MTPVTIGGLAVGGDAPCRFVAEVSCNHGGSLDLAFKLIDAAKDAGADYAKFQCYTPEELVLLRGDGPAPDAWGAQGYTMRTLYEEAQTPHAWFPRLAAHCRSIGLPWFSSVFGLDSLAVLESVDCPAYKIARLDNHHSGLIASAASLGKPVLVSTSSAPPAVQPGVSTLWCPPGYPTKPSDVHLPLFGGAYLGLSSHCMDGALPVAAVARGAKLLEYHMMLAESPSGLESSISLTQHQFAQMIRDVRTTEAMLA